MNTTIQKLILKLSEEKEIFITSIEGPTASGTTTFSKILKEQLEKLGKNIICLETDSFLLSRQKRRELKKEDYLTNKKWFDFDSDRGLINLLSKIKSKNRTIKQFPVYSHSMIERINVPPIIIDKSSSYIVLLNGPFSADICLHEHIDFLIYLHVPRTIRLERQLEPQRLLKRNRTKEEQIELEKKYLLAIL